MHQASTPGMDPTQRIGIVGAGPGGLCLGALLHKQGIPYTIYELRDAPSHAMMSTPSGMLDLHDDAGLAAIRACHLWDQFVALTSECSQDTIIMDEQGHIHHRDSGSGRNRPEVARNALTHLLLSANNPDALKWKHKLRSAASSATGQVTLDFGHDGTFTHDLVVGADGAWSKVRPLVTSVQPQHGGIHYTTLHIPDASGRYPHLAGLVGQGTSFILGGKNGLVTHRGVGGSICLHVSASSANRHDFAQLEHNSDAAVARDALLGDEKLFRTWSPAFQELIKTALENELTPTDPRILNMRPLYMLPVGHSWENTRGVTLLGDAAHLMMPWAGQGVNLAMRDALELSEAIVSACKEPDFQQASQSLTAGYEKDMFARSRRSAEETWSNSKLLFAENGAKAMADLMASYGPPPE